MRYLLVFLVALVLIWRWRTARTAALQKRPPPQETSGALTIVACTQCGVHVPIGDAVSLLGARVLVHVLAPGD